MFPTSARTNCAASFSCALHDGETELAFRLVILRIAVFDPDLPDHAQRQGQQGGDVDSHRRQAEEARRSSLSDRQADVERLHLGGSPVAFAEILEIGTPGARHRVLREPVNPGQDAQDRARGHDFAHKPADGRQYGGQGRAHDGRGCGLPCSQRPAALFDVFGRRARFIRHPGSSTFVAGQFATGWRLPQGRSPAPASGSYAVSADQGDFGRT
jgi:hypothetical protein